MTDSLILGRFLAPAALSLALAVGGCASGGFVDEGAEHPEDTGNAAKNMLVALGAVDDDHAQKPINFQPRAPLVVPPKRTLPTPVDTDAQLSKKNFPVNAEDAEGNATPTRELTPMTGHESTNGRALKPEELALYKDLPIPANDDNVQVRKKSSERARPMRPEELEGKEQKEAVAALENTGEKRRQGYGVRSWPGDVADRDGC